jgi:Fe-S cluster biogenesis protein NfuA
MDAGVWMSQAEDNTNERASVIADEGPVAVPTAMPGVRSAAGRGDIRPDHTPHDHTPPDHTPPDHTPVEPGESELTELTMGTDLTEEERTKREADLRDLLELMRPSVQADGGDLELVDFDVQTGLVEVQLRGACSSCAISSSTLQGGVERILMGRLDWVTEVKGGVDESEDPFESASLGQGGYVPKW